MQVLSNPTLPALLDRLVASELPDGRSIGVFNVQGQYYALRNQCPHQGAPLCRGKVSATPKRAGAGVDSLVHLLERE